MSFTKTMSRSAKIIFMTAFLIGLAASFWLGRYFGLRAAPGVPPQADTIRIVQWIHDTVKVEVSRKVDTIRVILPAVHDTVEVEGPAVVDSVMVEVPIEERTFAGENYRAVVRGFRPELTDIWVAKTMETVRVPVAKRWNLTAGPQAGVGITPDGWRPYAGVGITFGYSF